MELFLERPAPKHKLAFEAMMDEWEAHGSKIFPSAIRRYSRAHSGMIPYEAFLESVDANRSEDTCAAGVAPQDVYFLVDGSGRLLGAAVVRHRLEGELLQTGGHIGAGIRPATRGKGLGTRLLALALARADALGIAPVLITCNEDNTASARVIEKNGGVFENSVVEDNGTVVKRYWISRYTVSK